MDNFFDKNLFQQIVAGVAVLIVSILLGAKSIPSATTGKKWKTIVIISWFMILWGFYIFVMNYPNGNFNNPYTGLSLVVLVIGIILKYIGKFFVWWHR